MRTPSERDVAVLLRGLEYAKARLSYPPVPKDRGSLQLNRKFLRDDLMDHIAGHVRKPEITPAVSISQLRVIDPE